MSFLLCRYISRGNPRDNTRHVILSTASMRPTDFAAQLNVSLANGWGIVRTVTDMCMKMPEGKYVLVKDPNKVKYLIRLPKFYAMVR
jgi:translation initiation factor 3 subunit D